MEMFATRSADDLLTGDIQDTWVDPDAFNKAFSIFRKGEVLVNFEAERKRFDGSKWWVLMNTQPITFDNRAAGIVWHIDISDRKHVEADLLQAKHDAEHASHAKSDFLAHVSHELRTPLNCILGFSQILSSESANTISSASRSEYARNIYSSGGHLLAIINDILDISKIEAGEFELDESAFDVEEVLSTAHEMLDGMAENGDIAVTCTPPPAPIGLFADKRVVTQIIVNLLSNAIKFNKENGRVAVSTALGPDDGLSIIVADTGIGISAADIPRVLAPFGQVRSSSHRTYGGTGLGLSLSKHLVELHGGSLTLESEFGKGTTVCVTFPRERTNS